MPNICINGKNLAVNEGSTILEATQAAGIHIPTLCYLKERNAIASCRICCVELEGEDDLVTACNTLVRDGMVVKTTSQRVEDWRHIALELILAEHAIDTLDDCANCLKDQACELQTLCRETGITQARCKNPSVGHAPRFEDNPLISFNPNLCIACQRCVSTCNDVVGNHSLKTGRRGTKTTIVAPFGKGWKESMCETCGNCVQACPTAALTMKRRERYREQEVEKVLTTCPHCAVGCQLYLKVKDGKVVDTEGANGPTNHSLLCIKGRSASFDFIDSPDRLRTPLIKNHATGEFEEASWDEALDVVARRFSEIKAEKGGDALAAFACSRSTNEDIYLFQKMSRVVLETNNIDNCARV
jgi:predicted molibdopterin-dependent oxidoreductase YjgC